MSTPAEARYYVHPALDEIRAQWEDMEVGQGACIEYYGRGNSEPVLCMDMLTNEIFWHKLR